MPSASAIASTPCSTAIDGSCGVVSCLPILDLPGRIVEQRKIGEGAADVDSDAMGHVRSPLPNLQMQSTADRFPVVPANGSG